MGNQHSKLTESVSPTRGNSSKRWPIKPSGGMKNKRSKNFTNGELSRYNFQRLEHEDHIRLLTILDVSAGEIDCSIQHVAVSKGEYQALSYVWGDNNKPFRAYVRDANGQRLGFIPLTENLHTAMQDLWAAKELISKTFWIDQICIDQEAKEKNHQVAMMGKIYKSATRVITYIGPSVSEEQEQKGILLLERIYKHFSPNYEHFWKEISIQMMNEYRSELPVQKLSDDLKDELSENNIQWLTELGFGEWTSRLWIVQEQLLNSEICMLRGDRLLSWDAVATISVLFFLRLLPIDPFYKAWLKSRPTLGSSPWRYVQSTFSVLVARRRHQHNGSIELIPTDLRTNMAVYETLQCQDPRDRIFALLAISLDASTSGISPDYSISTSKLYHKLTIYTIRQEDNLRWLSHVALLNNLSDQGSPSWIFKLPRPDRFRPLCLSSLGFTPHPRPIFTNKPQFRSNQRVLVLKGQIVDRIALSTLPIFPSVSGFVSSDTVDHLKIVAQLLEISCQVLFETGIDEENTAALCCALLENSPGNPPDVISSSTEHSAYHYLCFIQWLSNYQSSRTSELGDDTAEKRNQINQLKSDLERLLEEKGFPSSFVGNEMTLDAIRVAHNVWEYLRTWGRSICVTEQKRISSIANIAKEGDEIAVFEGSDRLFALRPCTRYSVLGSRTRYKVVGDAYVYGLMRGEAYEGLDSDEVDYDIELV